MTRVYPNPELSLKEAIYIRDKTPIEVLIPVHGKIPLVVSETCFICEHSGQGAGGEMHVPLLEGSLAYPHRGRLVAQGHGPHDA